ncbi:signal peptidase I [Haladaptatus sp. DYF46]|uniref:signal peptidase I n=1 Tax=Haladaptatus sp. DYF46 TaxID=2886041 RepID=UPI001E4EEC1F|nr:signal peptidase I [Haladaptatus sp. DYF46]
MITKKQALKYGAILVVGLALVPFVIYAVPQVAGADHSYVVLSESMQPAIRAGDAILVASVPPQTIDKGDIITFRAGAVQGVQGDAPVVTHRVAKVKQTKTGVKFRTKGDGNEKPDPEPVAANDVIGQVKYTIPYLGFAVAFASTTKGFLLLVALPVALLVVNEVWMLTKAWRNTR